MRILGIYKILNKTTGKFYIGKSANSILHRWNVHRYLLRKGKHKNIYLQNAWNKYGECDFEFTILEVCNKDIITIREQHWMDVTGCYDKELGYNINPNAETSIGKKFRQETKDKIGAANKGKLRTAEQIERISKAQFKRQKEQGTSKETRAKISAFHKGKSKPKDRIAKIALAHRKKDKWPHPWGVKCPCNECLEKRRAYARHYAKEKKEMVLSGKLNRVSSLVIKVEEIAKPSSCFVKA